MTHPIQVEVLNQADWWLPWLPVLGSLLVAIGAVVGVVVNNKTNQKAIDAANDRARVDREHARQQVEDDRQYARDRDLRMWQRDTILAISTQVVEAALNAQDEYNSIARSVDFDIMNPSQFRTIDDLGRKIGAASASLRIIGAHDLADRCRDIRQEVNSGQLVDSVLRMGHANKQYLMPGSGDAERDEVARLASQLQPLLENINQARARFGETAEAVLALTSADVFMLTEDSPPSDPESESAQPQDD